MLLVENEHQDDRYGVLIDARIINRIFSVEWWYGLISVYIEVIDVHRDDQCLSL